MLGGNPFELPAPVPWVARYWRSPGVRPPEPSTSRTSADWEGPLGAVSPLLRPSWLTALPHTSATGDAAAAAAGAAAGGCGEMTSAEKPSPLP